MFSLSRRTLPLCVAFTAEKLAQRLFFWHHACYGWLVRFKFEFHLSEDKRRGFHTSQLIDYTLEPNPDADDDKKLPPQKLALAFSTADVVLLGWRLGLLADKLQENDLAAVRTLSKRYAEVDRHMPFVASITITPIAKG